jgi:hypothetical protein
MVCKVRGMVRGRDESPICRAESLIQTNDKTSGTRTNLSSHAAARSTLVPGGAANNKQPLVGTQHQISTNLIDFNIMPPTSGRPAA